MKIRSIVTVLSLLAIPLAGCNDEQGNAPKQQQSAEINRLDRELQKAETTIAQQESAKTWWQTAATILAIAAVSLLIVGTLIGSSARHESER